MGVNTGVKVESEVGIKIEDGDGYRIEVISIVGAGNRSSIIEIK